MGHEHESFAKVIAEKRFIVGSYQRPYAWRERQLRDLWDDLDLMGKGEHYAGTLVLRRTGAEVQISTAGEDLTEYEVVDGQQRLTTVTILLDRVRWKLVGLQDPGIDGVQEAARQLTSFVEVTCNGFTRPRLTLGNDLDRFWVDSVIGPNAPTSKNIAAEERLLAAVSFFDEKLATLVDQQDRATAAMRLLDLRRRITSGLKLLVYEVGSSAEVGVIFETLNDRGRPLTPLEKIKNYLLYLASQLDEPRKSELGKLINERWSQIFKQLAGLGDDLEDRLLRAHWLATQSPDRRTWTGADAVKEKFPRNRYVPSSQRIASLSDSPQVEQDGELWREMFDDISAYVNTLQRCAAFLFDLYSATPIYSAFRGDPEGLNHVRKHSNRLLRSGVVAPFLPILFASRLAHPSNARLYGDLLKACETFAARVFAVASYRGGTGQSFLAGVGHRIYKKSVDPREVVNEVYSKAWTYADDDMLRRHFAPGVNWYARNSHKYLLYEYELSLGKTEGVLDPFTTFVGRFQKTTEHILPQTPKGTWTSTFSEEQRKQLTHSLGNLVLTMDNSSYGAKEFVDKRGDRGHPLTRPCYATASLASEREIAKSLQWGPAEVTGRLQHLESWTLQRWAIPDGCRPNAVEDDDDDDRDLDLTGTSVTIDGPDGS